MSSKLSWSANNCPFFLHVFQISPRQCRSFDRSGEVTDGANIYIFLHFQIVRASHVSFFSFHFQVARHGVHGPPLYPVYLVGVNIWNNLVFGNLGR